MHEYLRTQRSVEAAAQQLENATKNLAQVAEQAQASIEMVLEVTRIQAEVAKAAALLAVANAIREAGPR